MDDLYTGAQRLNHYAALEARASLASVGNPDKAHPFKVPLIPPGKPRVKCKVLTAFMLDGRVAESGEEMMLEFSFANEMKFANAVEFL